MENNHMASPALHFNPEEIDNIEKRRKYTVSIIGCGRIGILHAYLFAEAGFKIICADVNQTVVTLLAKGKAPFLGHENEAKLKNYAKNGNFNCTNDVKTAVTQSDIILITVPLKIDTKKHADYSDIERACKEVGASLHHGSIVFVMNIYGIGTTEGLIRENLENTSGLKAGIDFGLAYSPIQIAHNQTSEIIANLGRVVAAADKNTLGAASAILASIIKSGVQEITNIKTAEAATLFGLVQDDVDIALANEFALLCERAGVDYLEARRLANMGRRSCLPLPTLADEDHREKPHILLEDAENLNAKLRIPAIAREINEEITKHVANLVKDALTKCGKTLRRARVSLLGLSRTPNMKDSPKKIIEEIAKTLETRGAKISLYDPYFLNNEQTERPYVFKESLIEAAEGADCIIILVEHDQFKRLNLKNLKVIMRMPAAIVDLAGIAEPDKVEKEGIVYRGLGRGVWTK
jgi:nucleotide sugar dehydrogenase